MSETLFDTFHSRYDRALSMVGKVKSNDGNKLGRIGIRHHEHGGKDDEPVIRDVYFTTPKSQLKKPGIEKVGMRMMLRISHGVDSVVTAQGVEVYDNGRLQAGIEMRCSGTGNNSIRWIRAFQAIDPAQIIPVDDGEPVRFNEANGQSSLTVATLEDIDPVAAGVVAAVSEDVDRLLLESFNIIGS